MHTLEDEAFGGGVAHPCARRPADALSAYMFPATVTIGMVAVASYLLCKGLEYQDLFRGNPRYRSGLLAVNGAAIVLGVALLPYGGTIRQQSAPWWHIAYTRRPAGVCL